MLVLVPAFTSPASTVRSATSGSDFNTGLTKLEEWRRSFIRMEQTPIDPTPVNQRGNPPACLILLMRGWQGRFIYQIRTHVALCLWSSTPGTTLAHTINHACFARIRASSRPSMASVAWRDCFLGEGGGPYAWLAKSYAGVIYINVPV